MIIIIIAPIPPPPPYNNQLKKKNLLNCRHCCPGGTQSKIERKCKGG